MNVKNGSVPTSGRTTFYMESGKVNLMLKQVNCCLCQLETTLIDIKYNYCAQQATCERECRSTM